MLSKTATYWMAGLGVVGVAAVTPAILKYYGVRPGAAVEPAPGISQSEAPNAAAAPKTRPSLNPNSSPAGPVVASTEPPSAADSISVARPLDAPKPGDAPAPPSSAAVSTSPARSLDAPKPGDPPTQADPGRPAFDVVRVEPTGDAVIAGRASPRAAVELRSDGRVVAEVDADDSGQFAILPPPFSAGGHRLQLAARSGGSPEVLSDAIGIDVPAAAGAPAASPSPEPNPPPASPKPIAPAPRPGEATAPSKSAPSPGPKVAALHVKPVNAAVAPLVSILSVEASGTGRFEANGAAAPNTIVRLYLNNSFLAEAVAGADGRWSLTVERGMSAGAYAIRADEIDRANGAVVARAEVPFNYPERPAATGVALAAAPTPAKAAPAKPAAEPATGAAAPAAELAATPAAPAAAAKREPKTPAPKLAAATPAPAPTDPAPAAPATATSTLASAAPAVTVAEPAKPAGGANPVVPEIRTAKVVRGDNLWDLSRRFYGYGPHYKVIYEANASQIRNPRLIYPDQIFVVPRSPPL
jgi:nucleoid-associated protein YgaU